MISILMGMNTLMAEPLSLQESLELVSLRIQKCKSPDCKQIRQFRTIESPHQSCKCSGIWFLVRLWRASWTVTLSVMEVKMSTVVVLMLLDLETFVHPFLNL